MPGVGKSTLASRWAEGHPGTLLLDVDVLRTWVSGWREDFAATGSAVRPVAIAMLAAYVGQGREVVFPQLLAEATELDRFRHAAEAAGGRWVEVLVEAVDAASRFAARDVDQPYLEAVHRLVAGADPSHLTSYAERLRSLAGSVDGLIRLPTTDDDVDGAYAALVSAVG
jgi:predicted kinase